MKIIGEISELKTIISENSAVITYFYNDSCAPCKALRPKIMEMVSSRFSKLDLVFIDSEKNPTIASNYNVFASPTIIVFFDSRETIRVSKYVSISDLESKIGRYYSILFD